MVVSPISNVFTPSSNQTSTSSQESDQNEAAATQSTDSTATQETSQRSDKVEATSATQPSESRNTQTNLASERASSPRASADNAEAQEIWRDMAIEEQKRILLDNLVKQMSTSPEAPKLLEDTPQTGASRYESTMERAREIPENKVDEFA